MNNTFLNYIKLLEPAFQHLIDMEPVTVATLPSEIFDAGVYLFSEDGNPLYVGRSDTLRRRLQLHCRPSSGHNSATFAFKIAREVTGNTEVSYKSKGSRSELQHEPVFAAEFLRQKQRIRNMNVQYIEEKEPIVQALLEMYTAIELQTPYNDFDNH